MNKSWPKVRLIDALIPVSRGEVVDASKEYRLLGIRLDGNGPFLRETLMGSSSSATKLFRVAEGDFIYSRLFACRGAFGVIGAELDGCYVSGEFPTFRPVAGRLDLEFLRLWFRLPTVIATVDADCSGSTPLTRNRFKEHFFLALEIPLPPLAEQRRVVARIEELSAQIHEARTLRKQAAEEAEALTAREAAKIFNEDFPKVRLGNVSEFINGDRGKNYPNKVEYVQEGVPWINTGHIEPDGSLSLRWMHYLTREKFDSLRSGKVRPGDLVYCLRGATLGKTAIITQFDEGAVASSLVIIRPSTELDSRFAYWFLISPLGREQIFRFDNGSAQPNLSANNVKKYWIPLPSLPEQRRIVAELDALQAEVDALKRLQAGTAAELAALLPALLDRAFKGGL